MSAPYFCILVNIYLIFVILITKANIRLNVALLGSKWEGGASTLCGRQKALCIQCYRSLQECHLQHMA